MSLDNGFKAAQKAYDQQEPPAEDKEVDCPKCNGDGILSDGICQNCDGEGYIYLTPEEYRKLKKPVEDAS
jgi:DnaJ-class molecular chaperone